MSQISEYVAQQTERAAESYCHFLRSTHPERLDWQPTLEGAASTRSVLEQVAECITVNYAFASIMRGEAAGAVEPTPTTADAACDRLNASVLALTSAIRSLNDDDLNRNFQHPRATIVGRNLILQPMRNMIYHMGQLNLIQMLYGDGEFHVPGNWR